MIGSWNTRPPAGRVGAAEGGETTTYWHGGSVNSGAGVWSSWPPRTNTVPGTGAPTPPPRTSPPGMGLAERSLLTFSAWMGLVTLNLSMVERMMEGVVRKNSTTKSTKLMPSHWSHQRAPWTERFFLRRRGHGPCRLNSRDPATNPTNSARGSGGGQKAHVSQARGSGVGLISTGAHRRGLCTDLQPLEGQMLGP